MGIYEVYLNFDIDPDDKEEYPEFSHEIRSYLGVILKNDGILKPPDVLRIAEYDVSPEWADDEVMFNATWDLQKSRGADLLDFLHERMFALIREIDSIPLENRNEDWDKFKVSAIRNLKEKYESTAESRA